MPNIKLEHDWFSQPLPNNVRIGNRSWVYSSYAFVHYGSKRPAGVQIGNDTGVYHGTFFDLGPDGAVLVGDYCSLVGVIFATNGSIEIGKYTLIAHEVVIGDHAWASPQSSDSGIKSPKCGSTIRIGESVWIGARAILLGDLTVGDNVIIGAGTVVTDHVPANSICVGNPMRILNELSSHNTT